MPTFVFTSPEGKSYKVKGPEGSTKEQAFSKFKELKPELFAKKETEKPSREFGKEARPKEEFKPKTLGDIAAEGAKGAVVGLAAGVPAFGEKLLRAVGAAEAVGATPGTSRRIIAEAAGIPEPSGVFGAGEFITELAGTAGAPGVIAKPLARLGMNRLAAYTAGGGFVPAAERAPGMLSDIALRAAGGGLAAAPVGYVVAPEDLGTVTGIGAAVPVVGKGLGAGLSAGAALPQAVADAITKAINPVTGQISEKIGPQKAAEIAALLRAPQEFVPGKASSLDELTAAAASPEFASLVAGARAAAPDAAAARDIQNALAIEQQGMRAATAAEAQRQAAMGGVRQEAADILGAIQAPVRSAKEAEQAALMAAQREALMGAGAQQRAAQNALALQQSAARQEAAQNALAMEQDIAAKAAERRAALEPKLAEIAKGEAAIAAKLPSVSPMRLGEQVMVRGEKLSKKAQNVVDSAYKRAFDSFPDFVDISDIQDEVTKVGQSLSSFRNKNMSERGKEALQTGEPFLSLPDIVQVRNEVSARLRAAASGEKTNQTEVAALRDILNHIDDSVLNSARFPKATLILLDKARNTAYEQKIKKFYEGVGGELLAEGSFGRQMLLPEDLFSKVLSKEQYAKEFVTSFADDPQAMGAFRQGVMSLYKNKAAPGGVFDPKASAQFLKDNQAKLKILDRAGLGIQDEINSLGKEAAKFAQKRGNIEQRIASITADEQARIKAIGDELKSTQEAMRLSQRAERKEMTATQTAEREAIRQQGREKFREAEAKYADVLGYRSADEMRRDVLRNPAQLSKLAGFMDEGTRKQFARDIVNDVVGTGRENIGQALQSNEKAVREALKLADPEKADKMYSQLMQMDVTQRLLQEASGAMGKRSPILQSLSPENRFAAQARIDELTKGFTPDQLTDAKRIVMDAQRAAAAKKLAAEGTFKLDHLASKAIEDTLGGKALLPSRLDWFNTTANYLFGRYKTKLDRKSAAELVLLFQDPAKTADLLEEAARFKPASQAIEKAVQTIKKTGAAAARTAPLMYGTAQE